MLLNVKKRDITGKQVKHNRKAGQIPASIYGAQRDPSVSVFIDSKDAIKAFKENGYSKVMDVQVEGESQPIQAVFKEVQHNPVKGNIVHASIHQIEMNKEITAEIPIMYNGTSLAVKNNLGLLVMTLESISVACLPKDLPGKIDVDLTILENVGDAITVDKLVLPAGVKVGHGTPKDAMLAYISAPQKVEEEVVVAPEEASSADGAAAGEKTEGEEEEKEKK